METSLVKRQMAEAPEEERERELLALSRQWVRLGVGFSVEASNELVDIESLIIKTAQLGRFDERLFVMAASWLASYHDFIYPRKLVRLAKLENRITSATLGAMLSMAENSVKGPSGLSLVRKHCRPNLEPGPLFHILKTFPRKVERLKSNSLDIFIQWGWWHNDAKLKKNALRVLDSILETSPEMRIRAWLGAGLNADIMWHLYSGPCSIAKIARETGSTYSAAHSAVNKLGRRGLISLRPDRKWGLREEALRIWRAEPR